MANENIFALESLKEESVRVYPGIVTVYPQFSQEEALDLSELGPKFTGCYATNNSTVCFVSEGEIFVTPLTIAVLSTLHNAGFRSDAFYVPFSNGDYPKAEKEKWIDLRAKARKSYEDEVTTRCYLYCEEHNIGQLPAEVLQNCFEMPSTGVRVKHPYYEDTYFPIVNSVIFDCTTSDRLGRYCCNNGKVVFVYCNGKTYVAKGYKIVEALRSAGYKETGLFVPFSNGERILDPVLKARWDSITK